MSFGKDDKTTVQTVELTPEQRAMIGAQTNFFTSTIAPAYQQAVGGARDIYNLSAPGTTYAAQNLAGVSGQAQEALGSTGESSLRTGIAGLENLFGRQYEQEQLAAALIPAQQQYQANLAGQNATFGGAGQLGSARQALANTALAGQTQATQQQAAAEVMKNISQQRLAAGQSLASLGQAGLGQAIDAAGQQVTAALTPQELYNKYSSVIFGTPATSYSPNFAGTQGGTTHQTGYTFGMGGANGSSAFGW